MNGMLKNLKRNCDIMHVAPFATISISIFSFIAGLFSSAIFLFLRHCERSYTTLGNYCQSGRYPLCGEAIHRLLHPCRVRNDVKQKEFKS